MNLIAYHFVHSHYIHWIPCKHHCSDINCNLDSICIRVIQVIYKFGWWPDIEKKHRAEKKKTIIDEGKIRIEMHKCIWLESLTNWIYCDLREKALPHWFHSGCPNYCRNQYGNCQCLTSLFLLGIVWYCCVALCRCSSLSSVAHRWCCCLDGRIQIVRYARCTTRAKALPKFDKHININGTPICSIATDTTKTQYFREKNPAKRYSYSLTTRVVGVINQYLHIKYAAQCKL